MKPGARIQAAIEILDTIYSANEPTERLIDFYFRKRRYAGSSDRRAIKDFVYNILRHISRLNWWIKLVDKELEIKPRIQIIAELSLIRNLSLLQIQENFNGHNHCPLPLTLREEKLAIDLFGQLINHSDMPSFVALEYPKWLDKSLKTIWPERLTIEMSALNQPAPLDIRVNTLKTTLENVRSSLLKDFINSEPMQMSPIGLRLTEKIRLEETKAYKMGWIEVQDEGSQLIALLCDAKPNMDVVDLCAGAGGKTLALAATMGRNKKMAGQLIACDISSYRLNRLIPRKKRAGALGIQIHTIDSKTDDWVHYNSMRNDRILVDAPCTGTGTWRRKPISRIQISPEDLKTKISTQKQILQLASKLIKLGGRIIYSTCSILKEENEDQLNWFVENHNDFQVIPIETVWGETIGGEAPTSLNLRLSPASNQTDGYFCAILEKVR